MPRRSDLSRVWLAPVFAATILAGCTKELTAPRIATLVIVSGSGQSGVIGASLSQPLKVQALDQNGAPAAGVVVSWRVAQGGGTVTPSQSTTDQNGEATTTFRLGANPGTNTAIASISEDVEVTFAATALTSPPTRIIAAAGNNQSGVVGNLLAQDVVVKVTDDLSNPKAGVTVTFAIASGGGSLSATSAVTDASGNASVKWTLGPSTGSQSLLATVGGLTPLTLNATATSEPAAAVVVVSGNNQTGLPGQTLLSPIVARVVDRFGNPVAGASVTFAPGAGSGLVNPTTVVTGANGNATTSWTLGGIPGPASLTATSGSLNVTFAGGVNVTYSSLSAGGRSTCGITVDNVLVCWGYNGEGQLGIGQAPAGSGPVFAVPQPAAATGNLTFRQTTVDLYHGCAITLSSIAYCWGVNQDGRLGTNNLTAANAPARVVTAVSFRMMATSRNHTCGLSISDRVYCWGYAGEGQIGDGIMFRPPLARDSVVIPAEVLPVDSTTRYQQVVAGGQHACAVTTAIQGSLVLCWGLNNYGQLGHGGTVRDSIPTAVATSATFSGRVMDVSTAIAGTATSMTIAAGYDHTCALDTVGLAWCWGSNELGQLGTASLAFGPGVMSASPIDVASGISFVQITAGENHTCGLTPGGLIYCWGSNGRGQLGNSNLGAGSPLSVSPTPVLVTAPGLVFKSVSAGDQHTCAITVDNRALCWGDNQYGQLGDNREHETPLTASFLPRWQPRAVKFQPQ